MRQEIKYIKLGYSEEALRRKLMDYSDNAMEGFNKGYKELERKLEEAKRSFKLEVLTAIGLVTFNIAIKNHFIFIIMVVLLQCAILWSGYLTRRNIRDRLEFLKSDKLSLQMMCTFLPSMPMEDMLAIKDVEKLVPVCAHIKNFWIEHPNEILIKDDGSISLIKDDNELNVSGPVTLRDGNLDCITILESGIFIGQSSNVHVECETVNVSIPIEIEEIKENDDNKDN